MKLTRFRVRLLLGIFFMLVIYEVATDGISSLLSFIPPAEWANFASDTVLNVLQIVIFSIVSTAVGARYVHRGYTRSTRSDFGESSQKQQFPPRSGARIVNNYYSGNGRFNK